MSLLGLDIGTTGCKACVYSLEGEILASSGREYDFLSALEGYAELDSRELWQKIKETIRDVTSVTHNNPVSAISFSSLGEAMVPVTRDRQILGNSILGNDLRGEEFMQPLLRKIPPVKLFGRNGNIPGVFYSLPKLAWLKKYAPEIYEKADHFLLWADFAAFMLGAEPVTNYSLANRTLLFDIHENGWSQEILEHAGLDSSKLAQPSPSGVRIGTVNQALGKELLLDPGVAIISGGHDQCCAALGSGITGAGKEAMYGMGTFICVVLSYPKIPPLEKMYGNRLNIEHHVVPGQFVSFVYNLSGGALVKWFRNIFSDPRGSIDETLPTDYDSLFREIPETLSDILLIPRFGPTGPPEFMKNAAGTIAGLSLSHTRGDIILAMLEGMSFYFKDFFSDPARDIFTIERFIANGGGSKSDRWLQVTADVLNKPVARNTVTEAGTAGAAILAGWGSNQFASLQEGVLAMVKREREFYPDPGRVKHYEKKFEKYKALYSFLR